MHHPAMRTTAIVPILLLLSTAQLIAAPTAAAALFKTKCSACHGIDGSGQTAIGKSKKLADLRSPAVQKRTDAELTAIIANGTPATKSIHAFKSKGLKDDQIKGLVGHIRTFAKKK
jgi:mono/diheme cytochrome c family protein